MLNIKKYLSMTGVGKALLSFVFLFTTIAVSAQTTATAPAAEPQTIWNNPLALTMLVIIVVLLLVIALLANVVLGTAQWHHTKQKVDTSALKTIIILFALLSPAFGLAQDPAATAPVAPASVGGLTPLTFYLMVSVIAIELIVILVMGLFVRNFLAKERAYTIAADGTKVSTSSFNVWWDKINSFRPADQESKIDLGHNYDGIRELDNKLPGWWLYGFYLTIIVGVIYLYRYHIAETAPLSKQEFEIAWQKGEEQKAAFLAKSANNVDENTVKLITDPAAISAAGKIFTSVCAACHGKEGQGGVGPNLTDDYWIHSGSVKDIFKTIKYGWPEKGMKSWKDDYSPMQIAQLTSYVKSLHGTNPPNPKEKQGELYQETATTAPAPDSAAATIKADTTKK